MSPRCRGPFSLRLPPASLSTSPRRICASPHQSEPECGPLVAVYKGCTANARGMLAGCTPETPLRTLCNSLVHPLYTALRGGGRVRTPANVSPGTQESLHGLLPTEPLVVGPQEAGGHQSVMYTGLRGAAPRFIVSYAGQQVINTTWEILFGLRFRLPLAHREGGCRLPPAVPGAPQEQRWGITGFNPFV